MAAVVELRPSGASGALPDPPVPPDADLRDFGFMPMQIVRLFGSRFHAIASDAEWRAGVTLWLKSYHQVPAGSLPDDDIELCRLAELGRDIVEWRRVREVALHGFVKCSDGRLYHLVVAEQVCLAWERRLAARKKALKGNAKRWGKPNGEECPTGEMSDESYKGIAGGSPDDRKGQGQGQGEGEIRERKDLGQPLPRSTGRVRLQEPVAGFDAFWAAYPRHTGKAAALKAWVKREFTPEQADRVIAAVREQSKWPAWTKDNGQFVPHASTWLNGERWEDESPQDAGPSIWGSR